MAVAVAVAVVAVEVSHVMRATKPVISRVSARMLNAAVDQNRLAVTVIDRLRRIDRSDELVTHAMIRTTTADADANDFASSKHRTNDLAVLRANRPRVLKSRN